MAHPDRNRDQALGRRIQTVPLQRLSSEEAATAFFARRTPRDRPDTYKSLAEARVSTPQPAQLVSSRLELPPLDDYQLERRTTRRYSRRTHREIGRNRFPYLRVGGALIIGGLGILSILDAGRLIAPKFIQEASSFYRNNITPNTYQHKAAVDCSIPGLSSWVEVNPMDPEILTNRNQANFRPYPHHLDTFFPEIKLGAEQKLRAVEVKSLFKNEGGDVSQYLAVCERLGIDPGYPLYIDQYGFVIKRVTRAIPNPK